MYCKDFGQRYDAKMTNIWVWHLMLTGSNNSHITRNSNSIA